MLLLRIPTHVMYNSKINEKIVLMWCNGPLATDAAGMQLCFMFCHQIVALAELASKPHGG
jgi:hypothetical protein